ncbi:MAG TPA: GvpL/GvpF family gas vesicle protein [Gemmatimonadaceae bacterium]|nr:GvpL/GvpF family gas vesicle protein [Gemmatimonadaceae bacterium]
MTDSMQRVWYVYGVVAAGFSLADAPAGLDGAGISLERAGGEAGTVAALASVHDASGYAPEVIERCSADVVWLGPRARAHDEVLTWASDRGAVVPMPMFTLFSGSPAVHAMLRERQAQLSAALALAAAGREYLLRVYRLDAELLDIIAQISPRLARLHAEAERASAGQRYLLERKLASERKGEARAASQQVAAEIMDALAPNAVAALRTPVASGAGASDPAAGTLVLDAAFLVASDHWSDFQSALSAQVEAHRGRGFRFDFTGPWPPYHFVRDAAEAARGA